MTKNEAKRVAASEVRIVPNSSKYIVSTYSHNTKSWLQRTPLDYRSACWIARMFKEQRVSELTKEGS